jgi:hypothetical protein
VRNPFDVRRHAHAEPWAWHPEDGKRVTGVERQRARLDALVLCVSDGGVGRLVAAAGRRRYDPQGIVDAVGYEIRLRRRLIVLKMAEL